MGRGIGKAQQRILDELAAAADMGFYALTVTNLAERTGIGERQARRAVRALEVRELVVITKGSRWHGEGRYGRLVRRQSSLNEYGPDVPTAGVVSKGETWPWGDGDVAAQDTEFVHAGMPTMQLWVWSPASRAAYLDATNDISQDAAEFGMSP